MKTIASVFKKVTDMMIEGTVNKVVKKKKTKQTSKLQNQQEKGKNGYKKACVRLN